MGLVRVIRGVYYPAPQPLECSSYTCRAGLGACRRDGTGFPAVPNFGPQPCPTLRRSTQAVQLSLPLPETPMSYRVRVTRPPTRGHLALFVCVVAFAASAARPVAQSPTHTLVVLDAGPATDVNDSGLVVGTWAGPGGSRGYTWTTGTGLQPITTDPAVIDRFPCPTTGPGAIDGPKLNDNGTIVGQASTTICAAPDFAAASYNPSSGLTMALPFTDFSQQARAVNSSNIAVGLYRGNSSTGFIWYPGSDLQVISGSFDAYDINDSGVVVGTIAADSWRAYMWTSAAGMTPLPRIPGKEFNDYAALAINEADVVVGRYTGEAQGVFSWSPATGISDLGSPVPGAYPESADINDGGDIIATFIIPSGRVPYLYRAGAWVDLNTLVPASSFQMQLALAINNAGLIVGSGGPGGNAVGFVLLPPTSPGGTVTVTNTNDSGPGSLRAAIAASAPGGTIDFNVTGTITLLSPLVIDKDLTISGPGAASLSVSGNNAVVVFRTTHHTNVTISGLTVSGGFNAQPGGWGGGILNLGAMTVSNCVITGNTIPAGGGPGGGIFNYSSLRIVNCTISGNSAAYGGGGVFNNGNASLEVVDSTISGNTAVGNGGGVSNVNGAVSITRTRVLDNVTQSSGGGLSNYGTLTVVDSTVSGNSNNGIFNWGGSTLTITGSTVSGNTSVGWGGGINSWGTVTIGNSTFASNTGATGGGIFNYAGVMVVYHSTFSGNRANAGAGGGIWNQSAVTIKNTIIADSASGGNCGGSGAASAGHNLSDDGSCTPFFIQPGDLNGVSAGLDSAGLQDNGSATKTIALASGSPALNAIPVSACTNLNSVAVTADQRGMSRPQGPACDMGSFEASANAPPNAVAGPDQGTFVGGLVALDGSASHDPDADPITFAWTLITRPAGSAAALRNAATATPDFVPDLPGTYVVSLVVTDRFTGSAPDTVTVAVTTAADFAGQQTVDALNAVGSLPASGVTTQGNQTALGNLLTQVNAALQLGDVADAKKKLQDAIERTDGCALRGAPDRPGQGQIRQDYIKTCTDQAPVYRQLRDALEALSLAP